MQQALLSACISAVAIVPSDNLAPKNNHRAAVCGHTRQKHAVQSWAVSIRGGTSPCPASILYTPAHAAASTCMCTLRLNIPPGQHKKKLLVTRHPQKARVQQPTEPPTPHANDAHNPRPPRASYLNGTDARSTDSTPTSPTPPHPPSPYVEFATDSLSNSTPQQGKSILTQHRAANDQIVVPNTWGSYRMKQGGLHMANSY